MAGSRDDCHLHRRAAVVDRVAGRLDQNAVVGIDGGKVVLRDPQLVDRLECQPALGVVLIEQSRLVGRPGRARQCQPGRWPGNAPVLETAVVGVAGHRAALGVRAQQQTRDGRRRRGEAVGVPATHEVQGHVDRVVRAGFSCRLRVGRRLVIDRHGRFRLPAQPQRGGCGADDHQQQQRADESEPSLASGRSAASGTHGVVLTGFALARPWSASRCPMRRVPDSRSESPR